MNQLTAIFPYMKGSMWMFDDPSVGLHEELFVSGIDKIMDAMTAAIPNAQNGFRLIFSGSPFPGHNTSLVHIEKDRTTHWPAIKANKSKGIKAIAKRFIPAIERGDWYYHEETNMEGWLCPALLKYFDGAPAILYVKLEADPDQANKIKAREEYNQKHPRASLWGGHGWEGYGALDDLDIVPGPLDSPNIAKPIESIEGMPAAPGWWARNRGFGRKQKVS